MLGLVFHVGISAVCSVEFENLSIPELAAVTEYKKPGTLPLSSRHHILGASETGTFGLS